MFGKFLLSNQFNIDFHICEKICYFRLKNGLIKKKLVVIMKTPSLLDFKSNISKFISFKYTQFVPLIFWNFQIWVTLTLIQYLHCCGHFKWENGRVVNIARSVVKVRRTEGTESPFLFTGSYLSLQSAADA